MKKENKDILKTPISKIEYNGTSKVKDDGESEKYTNEMYKLADKNQSMHKKVGFSLGLIVVAVLVLSILINTPLMKPKSYVATQKADTKTAIVNPTTETKPAKPVEPVETQAKIYEYLNIEANRTSILAKSVALNKGSQKGVTVYLLSEILRSNDVAIPANTSSVDVLMKNLISMGWKKNTDLSKLEKGDICFTTDMPDRAGVPSHTYVFMDWVTPGKTDYGNICDGQLEGTTDILHKRNVSVTTTQKDKFSFFLRK